MAIVARNLEAVSIVAVVPEHHRMSMPAPDAVFALFPGSGSKGARLLDDTALRVRVFTFPELSFRLIFEPTRIRLEALTPKKPDELRLGEVLQAVCRQLYPAHAFARIGFNVDIAYQYDAVIPQRELWARFLSKDALEDMTHFGFQMSFQKDKGRRRETYFCKAVSPLELRILANIELDGIHAETDIQQLFEQCYTSSQGIVNHLTFS